MNTLPLQHIVILGGGTAGWMCVNLMAQNWLRSASNSASNSVPNPAIKITLIESSEIGIIGVGEGSTPYLRDFFHQLEIPEQEWMPACNATYKCGIGFPEWSSVPGYTAYVHPFYHQQDRAVGNEFFTNACLRRRGTDVAANPQDFFIAAQLAEQKKAPFYLPRADGQLSPETDYAYHFDSGLLGQFLKNHAAKLGVLHQIDTLARVIHHENGDIAELVMKSGAHVAADFFIDCTGFQGLLINQALGEPFVSYKENLFNDRAIAMPTALDKTAEIASQTTSTALKHGWAWQIPLSSRFGNGYVYASEFVSDEQAEIELRQHLGPAAENSEARFLKMRVGRIERHWRNNCLAIGLSQGFIEPLEATALMLIQFSVANFIEAVETAFSAAGDVKPRLLQQQDNYNRRINQMFEGVRDYVVTHYQLNTRNDTEYWQANRAHKNISSRLASILEVWDQGGDFEAELSRHGDDLMYLRPSWYCLLAGMGRFPTHLKTLAAPTVNYSAIKPVMPLTAEQARTATAKIASQFYSHRDYLQKLYGAAW